MSFGFEYLRDSTEAFHVNEPHPGNYRPGFSQDNTTDTQDRQEGINMSLTALTHPAPVPNALGSRMVYAFGLADCEIHEREVPSPS